MKSANWQPSLEASISSELNHLQAVRANLSECVANLLEDGVPLRMTMALSFVQMAIDALGTYQGEMKTALTKQ
jgi:hypothetical protein